LGPVWAQGPVSRLTVNNLTINPKPITDPNPNPNPKNKRKTKRHLNKIQCRVISKG